MKRLAFAVLVLTLLSAPCLAQYKFKQVDFPGVPQTNLFAINEYGQYVGASIDASLTNHAIYFDGKTLSLLDPWKIQFSMESHSVPREDTCGVGSGTPGVC